jgi:hypothetical protein
MNYGVNKGVGDYHLLLFSTLRSNIGLAVVLAFTGCLPVLICMMFLIRVVITGSGLRYGWYGSRLEVAGYCIWDS